jgi:hypothetical protein
MMEQHPTTGTRKPLSICHSELKFWLKALWNFFGGFHRISLCDGIEGVVTSIVAIADIRDGDILPPE